MDRKYVLLLMGKVLLPRQNLLTLANLKVFNSFRFLSAAAIDIPISLCYNSWNTRNLLGRKFKNQHNHFITDKAYISPKAKSSRGLVRSVSTYFEVTNILV